MQKKLLYLFLTLICSLGYGQECPSLISPPNGSLQVPVFNNISWEPVAGVTGYIISLGTTPGGTEIVNEQSVGSTNSYQPPLGLPENTEIFVTITLFFFDQPDIVCPSQSFITETIDQAPLCTSLSNPINGSVNINPSTNLTWDYAYSAQGYRITLGTTPAGGDILNDFDVGNVLSYNPPTDLPPNTQIYVEITPYNSIGATSCSAASFATSTEAILPNCATMISPLNGAINVPLTPFLEWTEIPGAIGYHVSIGSSPFISDVLDNVTFSANSTFVLNFEPNRTFFITIVPFNSAGEAIGCSQESFSTVLGCGPYYDAATGELITRNPEINFPDTISFCQSETPFVIYSPDTADGYRWYKLDDFGNETLISENKEVSLTEKGQYRYEAYNVISQSANTIECPSSKEFSVISSEIATITSMNITGPSNNFTITVETTGSGDYEYALNNINGPYQDSNVFGPVPLDSNYTVYVRDKNGCGIAEKNIEQDLTLEGFPKFFSPNGDGINDFWQYIAPPITNELTIDTIYIFDRFGNFLVEIDTESQGWDGMHKGKALPASSYWFKVVLEDGKPLQGPFALKR
ncbi:gliding motility-associated-like protein [Saonia flava]|uniref:Gliding motility-associated-like protein n=1 Tax=Saonia flava TaxID=523696 RepID=A0A846R6P9_9FLAO|nr:T9SS type B sorting domain-containing protein [Saonia flava]NJB72449.1 gliding motility-associated-like protein [Saonia flava]